MQKAPGGIKTFFVSAEPRLSGGFGNICVNNWIFVLLLISATCFLCYILLDSHLRRLYFLQHNVVPFITYNVHWSHFGLSEGY